MNVPPMLAELGDPDLLNKLSVEDWIIQPKYDGERIVAQWDKGKVELWTRRDMNVARKFPEVVESMSFLKGKGHTVLDGELIVGKGHEDLMVRQSEEPITVKVLSRKVPAEYVVFDVLYLNGASVMDKPLITRMGLLRRLLADGAGSIAPCPSYSAKDARSIFERLVSEGKEGVVAKRLASRYASGKRTADWLKFKRSDVVDVEVIGARKSETGQPFASLIMMRNGKYFGCVGSGLTNAEKTRILGLLKGRQAKAPLVEIPKEVEPLLLTDPIPAEVKVNAILENGSPRAPVWIGFKRR